MSEARNKTTHAQRRRLEAREGARVKLRAGQFVRRLLEIARKAETAEPAQIAGLKLKADIYTRLLGKCLPDLKAIEHSGEITHKAPSEMTAQELDERIARLAAREEAEASGAGKSPGVH